ncbi:hypothetical protein HHI36_021971 [Cryptolaemus montrouzieri]|uniref:ATP synthase F0 subunit 8 n=1 Tax=Cryptolaemus montrouzieri TaxID=559131 RepID=A0ABD2MYB5_9CUCU
MFQNSLSQIIPAVRHSLLNTFISSTKNILNLSHSSLPEGEIMVHYFYIIWDFSYIFMRGRIFPQSQQLMINRQRLSGKLNKISTEKKILCANRGMLEGS